MKKILGVVRFVVAAVLCGILLLPQQVNALGSYTNMSDLAAPGYNTEGSGNDHWFDQTASGNGETYSVWIEGAGSNWDAFIYSKNSNTTTNLSVLLPGSYSTGYPEAIAVKVFSTGEPLVTWCEDNGVDNTDCFIYDGRTETIVQPSQHGTGETNGFSEWIDAFAIDSEDNYYLGFEHAGTRGGRDLFLYRSDTNSTIHLSDKLPVGQGTGTDGAWEPNYFKINDNNEAYFGFHSITGSFTRTFLYDVSADSLTNLSTLAGGVGVSGVGGSNTVSMQFLSNGKPLVLFLEDPTAIAGANARVFLYNASTTTIQNLDNLNPDIANYTYSYFYFPGQYNTFALRMQGDTPYAVWSSVVTADNTSNIVFYNGDTGTVRDISKLIPSAADYAWWAQGLLGFDGDGNPYVYFKEAASSTSAAFYRYDGNANTVSTAIDSVRWMDFMQLVDRPDAEPFLVTHVNVPTNERHIRIIDMETLAVTDLTSLTSMTSTPNAQRPVATLADGELIVAWIQDDIPSIDSLFVYDGHDGTVTNYNTALLVPNGEGGDADYDPYIHTDENRNAVITWSGYVGLRGEGDRYMYTIEASNPPPTDPDDDDDTPDTGGGAENTTSNNQSSNMSSPTNQNAQRTASANTQSEGTSDELIAQTTPPELGTTQNGSPNFNQSGNQTFSQADDLQTTTSGWPLWLYVLGAVIIGTAVAFWIRWRRTRNHS